MGYNVPSNVYGNAFSQALDRLSDVATQTILKERKEKRAREREYRADMMGIMIKNAPHISWTAFGDPLENKTDFSAASSAYQDWFRTAESAVNYSPTNNILSEEAATDLTPPTGRDPYTDITELGVTASDVDVVNQWITGQGNQAKSMGWSGLINQMDEDGEHYIDDADFSELSDMGLIRPGESWENARVKLQQRWNWWQSSYKAENESFKGSSEYMDLEKEEIGRRNTAIAELTNTNPDYAINKQDLLQINNIIQGSTLAEHSYKKKNEDDERITETITDMYYKNINIPEGILVQNEDGTTTPLQASPNQQIEINQLNNMIELNRSNNPEWVADVELLKKFSSFSTLDEVSQLILQNNGLPYERLKMISPNAAATAMKIINKAKYTQNAEDDFGVSQYKSSGDLVKYKTEAALSLEAYSELNIDLGLNTGGTGLVDTFKKAYQSGNQQDMGILKEQLTEIVSQYGIKYANSKGTDLNSKWILDYLKSLDTRPGGGGDPTVGMFNHFEKLLTE